MLTLEDRVAIAAPGTPIARERRLHVASAEASSYLINDWNRFQENYLPLYVGDDDPRTAWNLQTEGIGEWLRLRVTPMEGATRVRLKVRNGYQKTAKLFAANSRARGITVVLLPSQAKVDVELADQSGWQEIAVDQPAGAVDAVEIRIRSVYAGGKYDDLCLSDVQLFVTATSSDNPAFEKLRFEKIASWKKERIAAARLFQTQLGKTLPIAPQYLGQELQGPKPGKWVNPCPKTSEACWYSHVLGRATKGSGGKHAEALQSARELAKDGFAGMTAVRISPRDKRPIPRVDGLCTPSLDFCEADTCYLAAPMPIAGQLAYLNTEAMAVVEQSGLPTLAAVMEGAPPQCRRASPSTFAWIKRDPAADGGAGGRIRALLLATCGEVESREGPALNQESQLLVYGADGWLELLAGASYVATMEWERSTDGPKLARAARFGSDESADWTVQSGVAVAGK